MACFIVLWGIQVELKITAEDKLFITAEMKLLILICMHCTIADIINKRLCHNLEVNSYVSLDVQIHIFCDDYRSFNS